MALRKLTEAEIAATPKKVSVPARPFNEQAIRKMLADNFKYCKQVIVYNGAFSKIKMTGAEFSRAVLRGLHIDKYTSVYAPHENRATYTKFMKGYVGLPVLCWGDCVISEGRMLVLVEDTPTWTNGWCNLNPYLNCPEQFGYSFYDVLVD